MRMICVYENMDPAERVIEDIYWYTGKPDYKGMREKLNSYKTRPLTSTTVKEASVAFDKIEAMVRDFIESNKTKKEEQQCKKCQEYRCERNPYRNIYYEKVNKINNEMYKEYIEPLFRKEG